MGFVHVQGTVPAAHRALFPELLLAPLMWELEGAGGEAEERQKVQHGCIDALALLVQVQGFVSTGSMPKIAPWGARIAVEIDTGGCDIGATIRRNSRRIGPRSAWTHEPFVWSLSRSPAFRGVCGI